MNASTKFIELDKGVHDRASFECGESELDTFLKTHAAKHMKVGVSKTMLLPAINPLPNGKYSICSFYTVAPSSIKRASLPINRAKKLPHYPVPVFLLAQLAVHQACQGQGLGKITLIKALEYLWRVNARMSAYAVIVDCLNENVERFYAKYGFEPLCDYDGRVRMFLPMRIVGMLF